MASLVTSVIGGIMGGNAAGKAANAQVGAAQEAAGTVTNAAAAGNQGIQGATRDAQGNIIQAGKDAAAGVTGAASTAGAGAITAAKDAAAGVNAAATTASGRLDPYAAAGADASGTLRTGLAAGGDFNKTPTLADLQMDPGYAFRLQQGQLALDRSAAARGGVTGGGQIKAQTDYAQGAASQEYQNAFARFQDSTAARYNRLKGVSDSGQAAAGTQGAYDVGSAKYGGDTGIDASQFAGTTGVNAARYAGDVGVGTNQYAGDLGFRSAGLQAANTNAAANFAGNTQIQAGNARAAGIIGKQNAYNGMLSSIGGTFDNAALAFMGGGGAPGGFGAALKAGFGG